MPEETQTSTPETDAAGTQTEVAEQTADSPEKDWKAEAEKWRAMSRETEKKAAANKAAADELAQIKDAQKTVEQRQTEELAAARAEAEASRTEALRWRIATTHGIPAEDAELFLTGRDEETMTAQAKRLAARQAPPEKPELRPDRSQGPRGGGTANPAQQFAEIIRNGTTAR